MLGLCHRPVLIFPIRDGGDFPSRTLANAVAVTVRRLTFVISSLRLGGAEGVCVRLANAMSTRGDDIVIITLAPVSADCYHLEPMIRRIGLDLEHSAANVFDGVLQNLRRVLALRRVLSGETDRTIISFLASTNVLTYLATRRLKRRVIVCERNNPARQSFGRGWDALVRCSYAFADAVAVNSQEAARAISGMGARDVHVVPNPMPDAPRRCAVPEDSRMILFVGRLTAQKAPDVLLKAFSQVAADQPEWRLMIVGSGSERDALQAEAATCGIAGRIEWYDHVSDLESLYARAGLFVLPSRFEGTPNVLLEAMAVGLPVIVSAGVGGGLDYVRDGQEGFVVAVDDSAALADAMARLMADPGRRHAMGQAGCKRIADTPRAEALDAWDRVIGQPMSPVRNAA